jgi:hypothetical protein
VKHSFDTEIFINVWPVDSMAVADDLEVVSLGGCRFTQPPGPRQRNAYYASVYKTESDQLLGHRNFLDPSIGANRNAHAMPPESFAGLPERQSESG